MAKSAPFAVAMASPACWFSHWSGFGRLSEAAFNRSYISVSDNFAMAAN